METLLASALSSLSATDLLKLYAQYQANVIDALAGNSVECPLCQAKFGRFLPFGFKHEALTRLKIQGGGRRPQAQCPQCLSIDRDRLVYLYLKNHSQIFDSDATVLHVAPERYLAGLLQRSERIEYSSIDIRAGAAQRVMDLTSLDLPDHSFDLVICNHVLEHIPQDRKAMAEIRRVLKPGGFAVLQVPIAEALQATYEDARHVTETDREREFGQKDHVRVYGHDYVERLKSAGFEVRVLTAEFVAGPGQIGRYALNPNERLFVADRGKFSGVVGSEGRGDRPNGASRLT